MSNQGERQRNFFDVCSKCTTGYSCCLGTRPPVTLERRRIIEAYLKSKKIIVSNAFFEEGYVFPRENENGYCAFHDAKVRKCLVHPVKPETCVAGPVTFDLNRKTSKIEWFIKMEKICPLAKVVYEDKDLLRSHLKSAKNEIIRLIDDLGSDALKAILKKDEPETFKIAEDNMIASAMRKI